MPSLRARIIRAVTRRYFRSLDAATADVQVIRRRFDALGKKLSVARGVECRAEQVAGMPAEWLLPESAADDKLLLYLHGGAYLMGSCHTHRQLVSHIARAAGVRALLPEYRLAPEHPYPAAIEDAAGLYRSLLGSGYRPQDIVIAGDSAGGGLTVATLLALRAADQPLPALACLLSPWLDLTGSGESMRTHAHRDPWFQPEDLPAVTRYYCAEHELAEPMVSPVHADLSGLPPVYIQVGSDEILLSDSTRAADAIAAAGGEVELEICADMWHVFQAFVRQVPEARAAVAKLGTRMRVGLGLASPSEA